MKKLLKGILLLNLLFVSLYAQETPIASPEETPIASSEETSTETSTETPTASPEETSQFLTIITDNAPVGPFIWFLIFSLSALSFATIVNCLFALRRKALLPPRFIDGVTDSMGEGDLDNAIALCEENNSPISNILITGFANIDLGFEAVENAVDSTSQVEFEKLTQKVGMLNLYGQLAPMLGLLGTVTGMVAAFDSLGNSEGAAKAKALGLAISQALWTTCAGLLIAIPAIFAYTLLKNKVVKIILESETIVVDLLKDLRDVELEDE